MKGKPEVIAILNKLLISVNSTALYSSVSYALCEKFGDEFSKLFLNVHEDVSTSAHQIVLRTVFLDGIPVAEATNGEFGDNGFKLLKANADLQMDIISISTEGIELTLKLKDHGTRSVFEKVLNRADHALDKIEAKIANITR